MATFLASLFVLLAAGHSVSANNIVFPDESIIDSITNPTCYGSRLDKIELNQSMYVQYVEFVADVPELRAFSTCFWINVLDAERTATVLNYAMDPAVEHDNLIVQYVPSAHAWRLVINGVVVYSAPAPSLKNGEWSHHCHSWDGRTGEWSTWQGGELISAGVNGQCVGLVVPAGGSLVTGQHQVTLGDGMDRGAGVVGSITLLHVSSTPLANARNYATQRAIKLLANDCRASDRGDVIGWLRTQRRSYGGLTHAVATEKCGYF